MAIDFMTMPLSRYLSGHFVTPAMVVAWNAGLPYTVVGPNGRREVAENTPFGGASAEANRARFVPMLVDDLKALPSELATWDEASNAEPSFHRVDPKSYEALLKEAMTRGGRDHAHVCASVFLPAPFDAPFAMPVVFERLAGSAPVALGALEASEWSAAAESARGTLIAALRDAVRLRLPMIVDA